MVTLVTEMAEFQGFAKGVKVTLVTKYFFVRKHCNFHVWQRFFIAICYELQKKNSIMNIVKKYNSWYYDREEKGFYGYKIFIIKNQF